MIAFEFVFYSLYCCSNLWFICGNGAFVVDTLKWLCDEGNAGENHVVVFL